MGPQLHIIAGPNGAGKTTFAREFLSQHTKSQEFVNADIIAARLSPNAPEMAAFQAGREMLARIEVLAEKRVPISQSEIQLIQNAEFAPEVGQSLATAYQQVMDRMAREIVDLMEAPTL